MMIAEKIDPNEAALSTVNDRIIDEPREGHKFIISRLQWRIILGVLSERGLLKGPDEDPFAELRAKIRGLPTYGWGVRAEAFREVLVLMAPSDPVLCHCGKPLIQVDGVWLHEGTALRECTGLYAKPAEKP